MKITKDAGDVAKFSYDALGRRVEKQDCKAGANTRRFYHNYTWQVLSEYDGSNNYVQSFVYGNYIDELLYSAGSAQGSERYYVHDHLCSTVAAIESDGDVAERYEYDAYGDCHVLDYDFSADADNVSDHGNPYFFTGRRLDILDGGSLKIYYYRNRYYDPHTGRFLTHDPLGITPNPQGPNRWNPVAEYSDGMNLYEYVGSSPIILTDPTGGCGAPPDNIGTDVWSGMPCAKDALFGYHVYKWRMVGDGVNPEKANLANDIFLWGLVAGSASEVPGSVVGTGSCQGALEHAMDAAPYCTAIGDGQYSCFVNWHAYIREYDHISNSRNKAPSCCHVWKKKWEGYKKCMATDSIEIDLDRFCKGNDTTPGVFHRPGGLQPRVP